MKTVVEFFIYCIIGVICILAGINQWKFPTIKYILRSTKYGELLNSIVWVCVGVGIIIVAFTEVLL